MAKESKIKRKNDETEDTKTKEERVEEYTVPTEKSSMNLTKDQLEQLQKTGMIGGDIEKPETVGDLKYILNPTKTPVILPDLKIKIDAHTLIDITKLCKKEDIEQSNSLRFAINRTGDLKAVNLEDIDPSDLEKEKSFLEQWEDKTKTTDEGTKVDLEVSRETNPFLQRLYEEEEKWLKLKRHKGVPISEDEVLLHKNEGTL